MKSLQCRDSFLDLNVYLPLVYFLHYYFSKNVFERNDLFSRRNFSLVARYSLKFIRCSLLVVKSLVTRCKICSLLVAQVACCKKSLVTRCRSCLLQKITRFSLQKLLVAKNHLLLVANFACYSRQQVTCYLMQKIIHHTLKLSQVLKER